MGLRIPRPVTWRALQHRPTSTHTFTHRWLPFLLLLLFLCTDTEWFLSPKSSAVESMCQVGWKASDKGRLVPAVWNTQAKPRPQMLADSRQPPLILWGCHLDATMAVNTQRNAASSRGCVSLCGGGYHSSRQLITIQEEQATELLTSWQTQRSNILRYLMVASWRLVRSSVEFTLFLWTQRQRDMRHKH